MKTYNLSITGSEYTFPVTVDTRQRFISFKGANGVGVFYTDDKDIQKGIESCKLFTEGKITCDQETNEDEDAGDDTPLFEAKEFPEVTDINGAVAVLKSEPYKVHHMKLKTPEAIREQAAICGVTFPNWK